MTAPLLLLDGASLWFRSFHALPEKLTAPDGRPVNAVRGFLDTVSSLLNTYRPGRLVVCRDDDWRPAFRVDALPGYKEHRVDPGTGGEDVPGSLPAQVTMIAELLAAAGIATAGAPGYEADDVIAALAAAEDRDPVIVVTGDRDLLQLVADPSVDAAAEVSVQVLYVGRGMARAELLGPAEVADRYGVPLATAGRSYAQMSILRGDPSDGMPGVPGIGEKTAARLLAAHGDLAGLQAAAADPASGLTPRVRESLIAAGDYLVAAEVVAMTAADAPVTATGPDTVPGAPVHPDRFAALVAELGIERVAERLTAALAG